MQHRMPGSAQGVCAPGHAQYVGHAWQCIDSVQALLASKPDEKPPLALKNKSAVTAAESPR